MDNYKTTIAFDLIPTYWSDLPKVKIRFNNKEEKLELSEITRIELVEELVPGNYLLEVSSLTNQSTPHKVPRIRC